MSGRPATMFRPEIIKQLRVLEFVLHLLGNCKSGGICSAVPLPNLCGVPTKIWMIC